MVPGALELEVGECSGFGHNESTLQDRARSGSGSGRRAQIQSRPLCACATCDAENSHELLAAHISGPSKMSSGEQLRLSEGTTQGRRGVDGLCKTT